VYLSSLVTGELKVGAKLLFTFFSLLLTSLRGDEELFILLLLQFPSGAFGEKSFSSGDLEALEEKGIIISL